MFLRKESGAYAFFVQSRVSFIKTTAYAEGTIFQPRGTQSLAMTRVLPGQQVIQSRPSALHQITGPCDSVRQQFTKLN
jgi:hypothetical protein